MTSQNSEELNNLYRLYGICAHHCANIEYRMALLLYPATWGAHKECIDLKAKEFHQAESRGTEEYLAAWERLDETMENVDKDIEKLDELTLGMLIARLKNKTKLSDDHAKYLEDILEKRNHLIHEIWGKGLYVRRLSDLSVIKEMTNELIVYERDFKEASNWLKKQVCSVHGVIDEQSIVLIKKKSLKITGGRR